jgi:uncharacterized protein (TIGR00369 family)
VPNELITPDSIKGFIEGSFPDQLGIEPVEITDEHTIARLVVDERHLHPGKLVHGGVWTALADTTAAWQTFRHLEPGDDFTTLELHLNVFVAGRLGDEITARAEHVHRGRSTHMIRVEMHSSGKPDRVAAHFTLTQFILRPEG